MIQFTTLNGNNVQFQLVQERPALYTVTINNEMVLHNAHVKLQGYDYLMFTCDGASKRITVEMDLTNPIPQLRR